MQPTLSATGLVKRYVNAAGQALTALNGVSIDVFPRQMIAVTGPSGSGKTTLMSLLGLLEIPDNGSVSFDGSDVSCLSDSQRSALRATRIGFVFQRFNLIETMDILSNTLLPVMYSTGRIPGKRERTAALRALDAVGLSDRVSHRPSELSGGELQRAAIARAVIIDQPLIIADEPTGNLDTATGAGIIDLLKTRRNSGAAIIVATHDAHVAAACDSALHIVDGRRSEIA